MAQSRETALTAAEKISRAGGMKDSRLTALFLSAREGVTAALQDGVQLLGGYGYMEDYGQERCMRDGRQARMLLGRDDRRKLTLAGSCLA
jgi:alkylation response protein AidB-like acyl-CoA dehydrogenase